MERRWRHGLSRKRGDLSFLYQKIRCLLVRRVILFPSKRNFDIHIAYSDSRHVFRRLERHGVKTCVGHLVHLVIVDRGVGDTVSFADVTPDAVTVYARISASNHEDAYVSFSVKINPADISIKLKKFQQYYHDKLLTSDEIFANMLDENTPLILDAEGFEDVKN